LAATALGLILSCFRWISLDQFHRLTGVLRPEWDDRQLDRVLPGFDYLVQNHFRYYEFTGNSFLAIAVAYVLNRELGTLRILGSANDLIVILLLLVLFVASRDALQKYYTRTRQLIGSLSPIQLGGSDMIYSYNGNDHGSHSPKKPQQKPQEKPQ